MAYLPRNVLTEVLHTERQVWLIEVFRRVSRGHVAPQQTEQQLQTVAYLRGALADAPQRFSGA